MNENQQIKGLLVTYYFPPLNSIAVHRMYSFAKYLNGDNYSLDILCPKFEGNLNFDTSGIKIYYTPKRKFDNNFGQQKLTGTKKLKHLIAHKFFKINYLNQRYPASFYYEAMDALKHIDLKKYNFIITSYGPLDAIHIGNFVKTNYTNIKWIIDYRDYYSLLEYYDMGILRFFFKNYERKITSKADAFITVSQVLKRGQEQLLKKKGKVIYNGFDAYQIVEDKKFTQEIQKLNLPILSYSGSLYQDERDVFPFLKFIKTNALDKKFCVIFAIINDLDEAYVAKCISILKLENTTVKRNLSHNQSLILQKESIGLLLFANFKGRGNGFLTGKVFEYMVNKKPIIYSGTTTLDYELYQLILNYNLGESFDKFDYDYPEKYKHKDCSFFNRKNQANELKKFITELL